MDFDFVGEKLKYVPVIAMIPIKGDPYLNWLF